MWVTKLIFEPGALKAKIKGVKKGLGMWHCCGYKHCHSWFTNFWASMWYQNRNSGSIDWSKYSLEKWC